MGWSRNQEQKLDHEICNFKLWQQVVGGNWGGGVYSETIARNMEIEHENNCISGNRNSARLILHGPIWLRQPFELKQKLKRKRKPFLAYLPPDVWIITDAKRLDCNCTVPLSMHLNSKKAPYENGDCELNSGVVDGSITFLFCNWMRQNWNWHDSSTSPAVSFQEIDTYLFLIWNWYHSLGQSITWIKYALAVALMDFFL